VVENFGVFDGSINIDTLTRLMKEFCIKHYDIGIEVITNFVPETFWSITLGKQNKDKMVKNINHQSTEFEAVLKATAWVTKEKGLLS